eukprot:TRINITY_DN4453_c0_g1_i5.p1 TRINITY_DN4453_c0_g1~~TRINITY_DN4453_c0_g1_i5.p1  ORF type:complete len:416 (-),score=33.78 TRINITY_DN4453_c0_g1_i5:112-1278(-)
MKMFHRQTTSNRQIQLSKRQGLICCIKNEKSCYNNELLNTLLSCQEKEKAVVMQNQEVQRQAEEAMLTEEEMLSQIDEYAKCQNKFGKILLSSLDCQCPNQFQELESQLLQNIEYFRSNLEICSLLVLDLCKKQRNFYSSLKVLEDDEKELKIIRKNLLKIHEKLNMVASFQNDDSTKLSLKYYQKPKISCDQLQKYFERGFVFNACVNFKINKAKETIVISDHTYVKKFDATNKFKNIYYIQIIIITPNTDILIEDCNFEGVGLSIISQQKNNHVTIRNFSVKNTLEFGIRIYNCTTCSVENCFIGNSSRSGMVLEKVGNCDVKNIVVRDAGISGFYLRSEYAEISDSRFESCKCFGVYVDCGTVIASIVAFHGNEQGDAKGKYIEK